MEGTVKKIYDAGQPNELKPAEQDAQKGQSDHGHNLSLDCGRKHGLETMCNQEIDCESNDCCASDVFKPQYDRQYSYDLKREEDDCTNLGFGCDQKSTIGNQNQVNGSNTKDCCAPDPCTPECDHQCGSHLKGEECDSKNLGISCDHKCNMNNQNQVNGADTKCCSTSDVLNPNSDIGWEHGVGDTRLTGQKTEQDAVNSIGRDRIRELCRVFDTKGTNDDCGGFDNQDRIDVLNEKRYGVVQIDLGDKCNTDRRGHGHQRIRDICPIFETEEKTPIVFKKENLRLARSNPYGENHFHEELDCRNRIRELRKIFEAKKDDAVTTDCSNKKGESHVAWLKNSWRSCTLKKVIN